MKEKDTQMSGRSEKEKKKCGCHFTDAAEEQREAIIKSLNKTSKDEALKRFGWKERR